MNETDTLAQAPSGPAEAPRRREEAIDAAPGRIGAYVVLRELGAGGMGVVYAAYHEGLDRRVALKLVRREANSPAGRRAILREAQALARLSHPNVVQVYEVGEHAEQLFVAMELVGGVTLSEWERAPGRPLRELVDAYRQAALGLRAAHEAGLVHRDFKPANAIVGADGRVRVLDFGLARTGARAADGVGEAQVTGGWLAATREAVAGTPEYMSPEQFAGRELDARSDIFSLCVALWAALYGARPFAGATLEDLRASVSAGRLPPTPARADLPERVSQAVRRGLARDPDDRWTTLDPLITALSLDPEADPSAARRERGIFFAVSIGLNVVIVVPLLTFAATRPAFDRRVIHLVLVTGSLVVLTAVSLVYRRALLRNTYHRRMLAFLAALLAALAAQRVVVLWFDAPAGLALADGALIVIGMSATGAVFFARWMAAPAGLAAAGFLLWAAAPWTFPAAMVVLGPAFMILFGWFWRRDARRGVG